MPSAERSHNLIVNISKREIIFFLMIFTLSACGGLGGEPEIIATLPSASPQVALELQSANITNGAEIFAQNCTDCHGIIGDGNGELVQAGQVSFAVDFTDRATAQNTSPQAWFDIITNGNLENLMPPWENALSPQARWDVTQYLYTLAHTSELIEQGQTLWETNCVACETNPLADDLTLSDSEALSQIELSTELSEDESLAVVAYLRTLALDSSATDSQPTTTEEAPQAVIGKIEMLVTNGTAGENVPEELNVSLRYGNRLDGLTTVDGSVDENSIAVFEDVVLREDFDYVVTTFYQDRLFISDIIVGDPNQETLELPLTIYELTEDRSVISISSMDIGIEPLADSNFGNGLFISQTITYNNRADRVFTSSQSVGNGRYATLLIFTPPGAVILTDDNDPNYIIAQEQSAVISTRPIPPGDGHIESVIYFLPYEDTAIIDIPLNNPLDGEVSIRIFPDSLHVTGEALQPIDTDDEFQLYEGNQQIDIGESLIFEVNGAAFGVSTSDDSSVVTSDSLLVILGIFAFVIFVGLGFVMMIARSRNSQDGQIDRLVKQIAQLDNQHDRGEINHDIYQRQRQELKAQLAQLMQAVRPEHDET